MTTSSVWTICPIACVRASRGSGAVHMELPDDGLSLEDVERELLQAALVKHDWNQTKAATYLNITRSALLYRMRSSGWNGPSRPGVGPPVERLLSFASKNTVSTG